MPFGFDLIGHGRDEGNLRVRVSFQSHVYSRAFEPTNAAYDFLDEGGKKRVFCVDRFNNSGTLPDICRRMLSENFLTWESKDRNSVSNMAIIDGPLRTGEHQVVLYYLFPSQVDGLDVEMVVKSAYPKAINFEHIKRRYRVVQIVKSCYHSGTKVPK